MSAPRLISPAMPEEVTSRIPDGMEISVPARSMDPLVRATVTTRSPVGVVSCSKAKSPLIDCPAILIARLPSKRTNGPACIFRVRSTSSTRNVSEIIWFVLLTMTLKEPSRLTPGILTATLPAIAPASPWLFTIRSPLPSLMVRKALLPSPSRISTFSAAIRVMLVGDEPVVVICSKEKSPDIVCPATVNRMSSPSTRM